MGTIIILSVIVILGVFISVEFRRGLGTMIASLITFTPIIAIGIIYNLFYPFYMWRRHKSFKVFRVIVWRLINGTFATLGNAMYDGVSIKWDEMGNVWGEWLEDAMTGEEKTTFGDKNTTISASIGFLEHKGIKRFGRAKWTSNLLNKVFRQKRHCLGSWEIKKAIEEINNKNFYN